MRNNEYTGISVEYDKINYRLGLNLEFELNQGFAINTAINYSNKNFTGAYYCTVCYGFILPLFPPEDFDFRLIEVPISLRYYFLPDKLRIFGEVGFNNQFLLNKEITDESYAQAIKLGTGVEYDFTQEIALQMFVDYNKGITNFYKKSDFKLNYVGLGIGIMKR